MTSIRLAAAAICVAVAATLGSASIASAGDCCCPPPPGKIVKICVQDPCTCCVQEVCVCVPCCCAEGEVPCLVDWRKGLLGRKILTYKFASCDYCVEIVILRNGDAKVR